jgi:hypothetical protein
MAELRVTPYANPLTGLSNDVIQGLLGYMKDKRRTQQLQGLAGLLESTGIPKTVERAAYADSPRGLLDALTNINRANVPLLKSETAEAAMTLAPFAAPVNRALMQATKGLPVGASIKPINLEKGIYKADLTMEEMLKVRDIPTVERVQKSVELVGEKQFEKMVEAQFKKYKPSSPEQEAMLVESVTLQILGKAERSPFPRQEALDTAQRNAALPIEQGGLGLPKNNTPEMRAEASGLSDAYHGSKQDITGLFRAGYDDNLAFATKDPEFASKWIGKGKLNQRIGAEEEIKAAEDLYRQIKYRNTDQDLLSRLEGEEFNTAYDKMSAAARAEQEKEFGLRGNATGLFDVVYPLKIQANKTFNPETDMDVMKEFFVANDIPSKLQDLYAGGNYMMYETKPVVNYLKSKGYDSMRLRESTGDNYPTIAVFNPETVRSRNAAFDPFRRDTETALARGVAPPDLLAGVLPLGLLADEEQRKKLYELMPSLLGQ